MRIPSISRFLAFAALILVGIGTSLPAARAQSSDNRDEVRRDESSRDGDRDRGEGRRSWRRFSRSDGSSRRDDRDDGDSERNRDERDREDRSTSSTTTSASSSSAPMDPRRYAKAIVERYDKNKNGWIDADERTGLSGPAAKADTNNDGVTTVDEVAAAISPGGSSTSSSPTTAEKKPEGNEKGSVFDAARAKDDASKSTSDSKANTSRPRVYYALPRKLMGTSGESEKQRSYRFKPPGERLPGELPSFFKSSDANRDGQVAMSEFSRSWSKRTVDEFRKYDQNDDGIITAKEATRR
jgi:hypothetical protein